MTETLRTQCEIWKAKAETWQEAFKLVINKQEPIPETGKSDNLVNLQEEQKIIDFIDKEITPQAEGGEMGAKGIWVEMFINWLKPLAIELAGKALEYLFEKGTEWAINGANFALLRLQDFLYDKYLMANDKQKAIFKTKILEKFPESGLASKLKNN